VAVTRQSELTSFDANAAVKSARGVVEEDLLVATEFTQESFHVLYLSDRLIDAWGNTDDIMDVGQSVHNLTYDDFAERRRLREVYPSVSETFAFSTYTDRMIIVRVLSGNEGMYFSLMRGTEVTPMIEAVKAILED
jgi:hypothetical protein